MVCASLIPGSDSSCRRVRAGVRIHVLALVGVNVTFMLCLNYIRVGFGVRLEFNSCLCWNHDYLYSNTNLRSCKNSGSS